MRSRIKNGRGLTRIKRGYCHGFDTLKYHESIIGAAFEVYRVLGYGFLEKIYQKAMQVELSLVPQADTAPRHRWRDRPCGLQ